MELRKMTQSEQKYTYRQSHQLDAQTGCIGYLRGDFGSTGKEFYSGWFDNMAYLKTPEFKAELDRVINALRVDSQYCGILADRSNGTVYRLNQMVTKVSNARTGLLYASIQDGGVTVEFSVTALGRSYAQKR